MESRAYPFDKMLDEVVRHTGRGTVSAVSLTMDEREHLATCIQQATVKGWERDWWPALIETREIAITTSSDRRYIALEGTDEDSSPYRIGTVLEVWNADPNQGGQTTLRSVAYTLNDKLYLDGANSASELASITIGWVKMKPPPPRFTREEWSAAETYDQGDIVYYPTTRQCYRSRAGSNTNNAPSSTSDANWELQYIPDFLADYVRTQAVAQWMPSQGRWDEADRQEAKAELELLNTQDRQLYRQGLSHNARAKGYPGGRP